VHAAIPSHRRSREPRLGRNIADRTGRFGMELHKAHSELGALEVYPQ